MNNHNSRNVVGIDVAKDKLDIFKNGDRKSQCFKNNMKSIKSLIKLINNSDQSPLIVMESTGGYEKLAYRLFSEANIDVYIAHPNRVSYFAKQKGFFAKTDSIDAEILMRFGQQEEIMPSKKYDEKEEVKKELSSRRAQIVDQITAEKCRLKEHLDSVIQKSIKRMVKILTNELSIIDNKIAELIESNDETSHKALLLRTFKGVGKITASTLICLMPELGSLTRAQIACLSGLAPKNMDSGSKRGKRRIAGGRFYVRKILYMASLSAIRHNVDMRVFYKRLKKKGKESKVALAAVMRKIIITLNAMVRDNKNWEPSGMKI